jgi:hypothetical protein
MLLFKLFDYCCWLNVFDFYFYVIKKLPDLHINYLSYYSVKVTIVSSPLVYRLRTPDLAVSPTEIDAMEHENTKE